VAAKSPSYALFFGQQYLARSANDVGLSPTTAFTISVTFDPNASEAAQSGTIVSKHHGVTAGRQGWLLSYDATTKMVTLKVYDSAGNWKALATAATITFRANVTFTFNAGTLNAYVNGALSNGTATNSGTVTAANASVEPLAIACDSASTAAVNPFKGSVSSVMLWNTARSAANIGTILPDGALGSAFALADADLVACWRSADIVSQANNDFSAWVDAKNSLPLTKFKISGVREVKSQSDTGGVLTTRLWDANLSDQALYSVGLTTTYTLSSPYRLWGASLTEPQISSGYSTTKNDFTAIIKCRKVTGRTTAILFKKYGISLRFQLSNKEMYCIIGDDTSSTLQNKRLSFGLNLFPVEGVDAVIVLRYNAVSGDADLFVNQIGFQGSESQAATNSFENGSSLNIAESCDFIAAAMTPACLSDTQVDTFVLGLSQLVFSVLGNTQEGSTYICPTTHPDPVATGGDRAAPAPWPAYDAQVNSVPLVFQDATTYLTDSTKIAPGQRTGIYDPFDTKPLVDDPTFVDPVPVVTSVQLSGGSITAIGSAGPTDAYLCRTWWEIELVAGQLQALGASTYPRDLFTQRRTFTDTFTVPPDVNLAGRAAVLVVQPQKNSKQTFRSAPYLIDVVAPTDPVPVVTSAVIGADAICAASVNVGATNAGPCTTWWEVESAPSSGVYNRISDIATNQNFGSAVTVNANFSLGTPTGWTGRKLRFVINPDGASTVFFRSPGYTLADFVYTNPNSVIDSVTISAYRLATVAGHTGISNMGTNCSVWWELEITTGEFIAVIDKRTGVDLSINNPINDTFTIPGNFSLAGKKLRLAVQTANGSSTFYSSQYTLSNPTITDPTPVVTAAACSLTKLLTASGTIGTSNLVNAKMWWEVEYTVGQFTAVFGTVASISLASGSTKNLSYQLPDRFSMAGKSIRLVVQSTDDPSIIWASTPISINQTVPATPTLTVTTAVVNALNALTLAADIGPTNLTTGTAWFEIADASGTFVTVAGSQTNFALSPTLTTHHSFNHLFDAGPTLANNTVRLALRSNQFPELVYYSSPVTIPDPGSSSSPNPVMVQATEDVNGVLTLQGTAGPTDIGHCDVWFEINIVTSQVEGQFLKQANVDLTTGSINFNGSIALPNRLTLGAKTVTMVVTPRDKPQIRYVSAGMVVTATSYVSPAPSISAATVSERGVATFVGATAASNIGAATYWWEIDEVPGVFVPIVKKSAAPDLSSVRGYNDSVTLPGKQPLTGRTVRLAIQQNSRPDIVYYSAPFTLAITPFTGTPTVTTATYSITSSLGASCTISNGNNFGAGTEWWEIEVTTGHFVALIEQKSVTIPSNFATRTLAVTLPDRFDLSGKSIRYAFSPSGYPETVIYSTTRAIVAELVANPEPLIQSFTPDSLRRCIGSFRAGPTNAAFCKVWWEVGVENDFIGLLDTVTNVNLFSQQIINGDFRLPRADYTGKTIRAAVQTNIRPENVYYSPAVPINIPDHETGGPVIVDLNVTATHIVSVTSDVGPLPHGLGKLWYEIEIDSDQSIFTNAVENVDPTTLTSVDFMFAINPGMKLRNKRIRAVFAPYVDELEYWYSDWEALTSPFFDFNDCTPQRICEVWHGAIQPTDPIPDLSVDVYDAVMFKLPIKSTLEPVGLNTVVTKVLDVNTSDKQLLIADAPEGMYRIKYVSGAVRYTDLARKNYFFPAHYQSCDTYGLWVISGQNPTTPSYAFGAPAFIMNGYPGNTNAAETAAAGYEFIFYHTGGDLSVAFDIPVPLSGPNTGSITVEVADLTEPQLCIREWTIVEATNAETRLDNPELAQPTLYNLVPGEVHLRRLVQGMDNKARWQELFVRVWSSKIPKDEQEKAQSLFPMQPPKPTPDNKTGWGGTVRSRSTFYTEPPTSGNA
jgi:hypothetical protein